MPELQLLPAQSGVFFREEDHKYFYQAQTGPIEVPSSSHIIALGGGKDFDKRPWKRSLAKKGLSDMGAEYYMERVRDIRADIGTEVHALIAHDLGLPDEHDCLRFCEEAYSIHAQWREQVYPRIGKVYVIERPMIHPGGCYGFTPDLVAEVDGILSLSDWKTNQAKSYRAKYKYLCDYNDNDKMMHGICEHLYRTDRFVSKKTEETTARVRPGWQMQQGSYGFGVEAVTGLKVERGINFMLSVDGVKEHVWNLPDLSQGWMQFAGGLLLHHQRAVMSGGHPIFRAGLDALYPLLAR
jgi:hypothetical protein